MYERYDSNFPSELCLAKQQRIEFPRLYSSCLGGDYAGSLRHNHPSQWRVLQYLLFDLPISKAVATGDEHVDAVIVLKSFVRRRSSFSARSFRSLCNLF